MLHFKSYQPTTLGLQLLAVVLVYHHLCCEYGSSAGVVGWYNGRPSQLVNGQTLDGCLIANLNFDSDDESALIIESFSRPVSLLDTDSCRVTITAPAGINIVLSILESSRNSTPSYLYVADVGLCANRSDGVCHNRWVSSCYFCALFNSRIEKLLTFKCQGVLLHIQ